MLDAPHMAAVCRSVATKIDFALQQAGTGANFVLVVHVGEGEHHRVVTASNVSLEAQEAVLELAVHQTRKRTQC